MISRFFCAVALALLAGCGGGGTGGNTPNGDLALSYSYAPNPMPFQRFTPLSIKPYLAALGSNKAHFNLASGRLPDGLQLSESTGEISGVPTSLQTTAPFSIALHVDGFSGSLTSALQLSFVDVKFYYGGSPIRRQLGEPIASGTLSVAASKLLEHPESTVGALAFSVDPATPLPAGLSLNPATGEITGAPMQLLPAPSDVTIRIVLNYGGASYSYSTVVNLTVYAPFFVAGYPQTPGTTFTFYADNNKVFNSGTPRVIGGYAGDTVDNFQLVLNGPNPNIQSAINALPTGLVFDSATGVISGTPNVVHTANVFGKPCTASDLANRSCPQLYWTTVSATVHRGSYSEKVNIPVSFDMN